MMSICHVWFNIFCDEVVRTIESIMHPPPHHLNNSSEVMISVSYKLWVLSHFDYLIFIFFPFLCRRPTALQDRMRDSDDDDLHDRDYDVAALANNLSQAFRYKIYGNEDNEEVCSWPCLPSLCVF